MKVVELYIEIPIVNDSDRTMLLDFKNANNDVIFGRIGYKDVDDFLENASKLDNVLRINDELTLLAIDALNEFGGMESLGVFVGHKHWKLGSNIRIVKKDRKFDFYHQSLNKALIVRDSFLKEEITLKLAFWDGIGFNGDKTYTVDVDNLSKHLEKLDIF